MWGMRTYDGVQGPARIAIHARDSCVHILYPRRQFPGLPSFIFRGIGAGAAGPVELQLAGSFSLAGFAGFRGFMGDMWTGVALIWRTLGDDVLLGISGRIDNTMFHLISSHDNFSPLFSVIQRNAYLT